MKLSYIRELHEIHAHDEEVTRQAIETQAEVIFFIKYNSIIRIIKNIAFLLVDIIYGQYFLNNFLNFRFS